MAQLVKNLPVTWETRVQARVRKPPGGRPGNPCQCSCLEDPVDRGSWWATGHGVAKTQDTMDVMNTAQHSVTQ